MGDRIRVLRIIARLNVGGPAIHVVLLNTGLSPERFESLLVTGAANPGEGSMLEEAVAAGVQPVVIPQLVAEASLKVNDVGAFQRLYRIMRQWRPHIVHTHTAKAGVLGRAAARLAAVPVVVHTYHGHILRGYFGSTRTWVLRRLERAMASVTDQLIAVSEQVGKELVAYGVAPASKITVIPLGLQLGPFLESVRVQGQLRSELGLPSGAPLIGIVGRLFPIKNHRLFLDAAALVARTHPEARFLVVGDGPLRPGLEARAQELGLGGRVVFTGWRRDLPAIYADLAILVVSSDNEGTPVSVIEAMAAGRPVVATRVGGLVDVVADGVTGRLVPAGDAAGLADAVERLLDDPVAAERMGRAGRTAVRGRFSAQRLVADIEALYDRLLMQKGLGS